MVLNQDVEAISSFQQDAFVGHWHGILQRKEHPRARKFVRQTCLASRFEQTRAKLAMHFYGATNDPVGEGIKDHLNLITRRAKSAKKESICPLWADLVSDFAVNPSIFIDRHMTIVSHADGSDEVCTKRLFWEKPSKTQDAKTHKT